MNIYDKMYLHEPSVPPMPKIRVKDTMYKDYTCVNCKTEEEAKALLKYWAGLGCLWNNGYAIMERNPYYKGPATCYHIDQNNMISVTTVDIYKFTLPNGIPVSYSEYMEREQQKWLREMKNPPTQETEKIKNGTIIHCNTSDEASQLLQFLRTKGYTWHEWSQIPEEKNSWNYFKGHTGYLLWNHKILIRDYWRWKMNNARPEECMEFSEFRDKHMGKENVVLKTEGNDTYKEALELCTQMLATLQKECDKYSTDEMNGASSAYQKCLSLFDELTKSPAEFVQRYRHVLETSKIGPGDIVEVGGNKTRVLITEMYKDRVPKCCIGVGLNLDSNFASVSISDDVSLKKIGHANLQEVLDNMMRENTSQDKEEFERE